MLKQTKKNTKKASGQQLPLTTKREFVTPSSIHAQQLTRENDGVTHMRPPTEDGRNSRRHVAPDLQFKTDPKLRCKKHVCWTSYTKSGDKKLLT